VEEVRDLFILALLGGGALFVLVASIGVVRMPDLYTRMSATSKAATFGAGLALLGVVVDADHLGTAARAIATIVFLVLTAPIAAHMIGRAAYVSGVPLWSNTIRDELDGCYDAETHALGTPEDRPARGLRTVRGRRLEGDEDHPAPRRRGR